MARTSLAAAIGAAAAHDPVLAALVDAVGPLRHRPRDPDGHFGALVRAIVFQQLAERGGTRHPRPRAGGGRRTLSRKRWRRLPTRPCERPACRPTNWPRFANLTEKVADGLVVLDGASRLDDEAVIRASRRCAASVAGPPRCT